MRHLSLPLVLSCVVLAGCTAPAADEPVPIGPDLRVLPYLQQPSSRSLHLTWFGSRDEAGRLEVQGPGLPSPLVLSSRPEPRPEMAYTPAERAERIEGLAQGSWLWPGPAFRHRVRVDGLQPASTYSFTLRQGGRTVTRSFRTAPTAAQWSTLRFIAFSDSETEPRGRVTRREWAPGTGSGGRPEAAADRSAWARTLGTTVLDGTPVLRYALTETQGFAQNLKLIDSRLPDFVLMPGDLVQGSGYQPAWDEFFRHVAGESGDLFTRVPVITA
jgi:hypothetical protein